MMNNLRLLLLILLALSTRAYPSPSSNTTDNTGVPSEHDNGNNDDEDAGQSNNGDDTANVGEGGEINIELDTAIQAGIDNNNNNDTSSSVHPPHPEWWVDQPLYPQGVTNDALMASPIGMIPTNFDGDLDMLKGMILTHILIFGYAKEIGDWPYLHRRLIWLNKNRNLLTKFYYRGAFTTPDNSWLRTRLILEEIPTLKRFFSRLETKWIIKHGWVLCYTVDGRHPFHADGKYRGEWRVILTLGACGKWMWFRKDENTDDLDDMVGVEIDHGMMVHMSSEGGGSLGIEHGAQGDAEGSWFIGLELDPKPEERRKKEIEMKKRNEEVERGEEASMRELEMENAARLQQVTEASLQLNQDVCSSRREEEKKEDSDDDSDDPCEIDEKDIPLVMSQADCSKAKAIKALQENDCDLVEAIMHLTT